MSRLSELIRTEIEKTGPMPFPRFMEMALYAPGLGYYEKALPQIGRRGDFFTSVSVGPLFGELLAFQFARWLEQLGPATAPFQIVEAGAHNGQLAADILAVFQRSHREMFATIEYVIVEPSSTRRQWQAETLQDLAARVKWVANLTELSARGVCGVIFSNELLDAMPVHRLVWRAQQKQWIESAVAWQHGAFVWAELASLTVEPPRLPPELLEVLPDGYAIEVRSAATKWWTDAARTLHHGTLLTIDYGGVLEELLSPGRTCGTLRAYSCHHVTDDVLANPGEQDITAHVNFSELQSAGEVEGLKTKALTSQSQFLTAVARQMWTQHGSWPPQQVRQFQTLTHPEHLGRPFRVLVQSRSADILSAS